METIHERIAQLMSELTSTIQQSISDANAKASTAMNIIEEQKLILEELVDTLDTIGEGTEQLAETLSVVSQDAYDTANAIDSYLDDITPDEALPETPSTDHTFEGYCKKCGKELYYDEYLVDTPAGRLCGDCHAYYIEHGTLDPVEEPLPIG